MEQATKNSTAPHTAMTTATPAQDARREPQQRRGRFGVRTPRVCPFCKANVKFIDFKQADQLRRFLTERGKIKARRKIGTCARHQRMLSVAIKRARHIALLPFVGAYVRPD